jgi:hypothetical protein
MNDLCNFFDEVREEFEDVKDAWDDVKIAFLYELAGLFQPCRKDDKKSATNNQKSPETFNEWELTAYNEMKELIIRQEKEIANIKMSKEGRRLNSLQKYFNKPIPKEIWEAMPDHFREYIKNEILNGWAEVSYTHMLDEDFLKKHPSMLFLCDTITVYYGPLAARTYNARTGECVGMS